MKIRVRCSLSALCRIIWVLFVFLSCDGSNKDYYEIIPETGLLKAKAIGIIGDSISSFSGSLPSDKKGYDGVFYKSFYPRGDVREIGDMWWAKVAADLGIDIGSVANCSWSGSTVTGDASSWSSAFAGCSWRRIQDLSFLGDSPSLILCFISCNDWAGNKEIGSWPTNKTIPPTEIQPLSVTDSYALMLYRIIQRYPKAHVACLTNLEDAKRDAAPGSPSNNGKGITVEEWNRNIAMIAEALGCEVIDLHGCGITYDNVNDYTIDEGLHPNKSGMIMIANKVVEEILGMINDLS